MPTPPHAVATKPIGIRPNPTSPSVHVTIEAVVSPAPRCGAASRQTIHGAMRATMVQIRLTSGSATESLQLVASG